MKKIILLSILLYSICINAVGQAPSKQALEEAQYQIIRTTVDFLATDSKTFGKDKPKCTNCNTNDYVALKKYADDNKLAKVTELINEWKGTNLDTTNDGWESWLDSFKLKVHDKIANGEKVERQKLKGYANYTKTLDSIVDGLKEVNKPVTTLEPSPMLGSSDEKNTTEVEKDNEEPMFTLLNIILAGCIVVAIILFYFINRKNKKKVNRDKKDSSEEKKKLSSKIVALKQNIDNLEDQKKNLEEKVAKIEAELANEREKAKTLTQQQAQQIAVEQKTSQPSKTETKIKYASYADQGDGFSASSLLSQSNSETIFEITLTSSSTASYQISSNSAVQRYAMSNAAFFLGTTCKYDTEPTNQQSIVTEKAGELKLQGNKWVISSPAIISFR